MDIITEIENNRSMSRITLSSGTVYWLKKTDLAGTEYAPGTEVEPDKFDHFVLLCQYPKALNDAVVMLSRRACGTGEIRAKLLRRRYSEQTIDMVLYKLNREKLTDDRSFSVQWSQYRAGNSYGRSRIRRELRQKGISEEYVEEAVASVDEEELYNQALKYAQKKMKYLNRSAIPDKEIQKTVMSLVRRGYEWDISRKACEEAARIIQSETE